MRDLLMALEKLGARDVHVLAHLLESECSVLNLLLQQAETRGRLTELVAGISLDGHDVNGGVRGLQVTAAERLHGETKLAQRSPRQPLRRNHLLRRVGDHPRQHESDTDGQQGYRNEDFREHGHKLLVPGGNDMDREQVGDAIEQEHQHHGSA
jgi:hypothetical protein